jgi:transposase
MDITRRRESAAFEKAKAYNPLKYNRFELMRNSGRTDNRHSRRRDFLKITKMKKLKTIKAWKLKEHAAKLWDYSQMGRAEEEWKKLIYRLTHSRTKELQKLGRTIKAHLYGILNAIRLRTTSAMAEARNSCIQRIKYMACGYRCITRFNDRILFQFGGLDMSFS